MGAAASQAVVVVAALAYAAAPARADSCTGTSDKGGKFATCFDPGNRLSITAATDGGNLGLGFGIALRHEITFDDDPDLEWKMSHVLLDGSHDALSSSFDALVYGGLFLRHSRDGHIVIPIGEPKKVFIPFDIGALAEVGRIDWHVGEPTATVSVMRVAPLVELARAWSHRAVVAIGPSAHWDIAWDPEMHRVDEHRVAPFTEGLFDLRLESHDGLTVLDGRVEGGSAWRNDLGWKPEIRAQASLERVVIAVDDRPVALTASIQYDSATAETVAAVGARIVLFGKTDPRVNLASLPGR